MSTFNQFSTFPLKSNPSSTTYYVHLLELLHQTLYRSVLSHVNTTRLNNDHEIFHACLDYRRRIRSSYVRTRADRVVMTLSAQELDTEIRHLLRLFTIARSCNLVSHTTCFQIAWKKMQCDERSGAVVCDSHHTIISCIWQQYTLTYTENGL
jgi:hypothetical protein